MNRGDIVDAVSEVVDNRAQARLAVDTMIAAIIDGLDRGERVHITNLGSFRAEEIPSRMVRNPRTGKKVRAKKKVRVKFTLSGVLGEVLAGRKKRSALR